MTRPMAGYHRRSEYA